MHRDRKYGFTVIGWTIPFYQLIVSCLAGKQKNICKIWKKFEKMRPVFDFIRICAEFFVLYKNS